MKTIALLAAFLALGIQALCALNLSEPPDHSQSPPGTTYTLDTGTNTFTGSVTSGGSDSQDNFQVSVPAGKRLTAVSKTTTGGSFDGFVTFNLIQTFTGLGTESFGATAGLPLGAGTYLVTISANFSTGTTWSFVFTVEDIPIIGVEQFDYPDGPIAGQNGGTFWDFGNIAAPVHDGTPSLWRNILGAPVIVAGRLVTNDNSALRPHNGPTTGFGVGSDEEEGSVTDFPSRLEQVVYHRVSFTTGATLPNFLGLSTYDFEDGTIFFGRRVAQSFFGIETFNGFGAVNSTFPIAPNTTYTLVAKVDYPANRISLFINPTFGGAEPAATVVINDYTTNNFSTGVRLASGGGGNAVTWDDLVSATSWAGISGTVVTTTTDEDDGASGGGTGVSLREAVKYSPAGSLITFAPGLNGQTCTLSLGEMVIDKALTIDASALTNGVTIDANRSSRHFSIAGSTASLTLKSLSLINGNGVGDDSGFGGAIYLFSGNLFLQRCTLSGNFAEGAGAIWLDGNGTSRLEESTLTGNRATGSNGIGGIVVFGGTCTLSRCTLSGNTGTGGGGGMYLHSPASVSLDNCIIAGNTDPIANDIRRDSGTLTPIGTNLIGSNETVEGTFALVGTQESPLDPKLSPLGYFGGPVQTLHPLIGSPAIDAAGTTDPGGTDARGFPRFVDGDTSSFGAQLDIGAVEAGPITLVSNAADTTVSSTLRTRITNAAGIPGARIGFLAGAATITLNQEELFIPATPGLFLDASNLSAPVTISGDHASRVFNIPAEATVAMHSLRIVNGKSLDGVDPGNGANGGGILNAGSLSLFSCTISGNATGNGGEGSPVGSGRGGDGGDGGGIFSIGPLTLTACTLSGNATGNGGYGLTSDFGGDGGSGGDGGGIFSTGPLTLTACTLSANSTGNGGDSGESGGNGGQGGGIRKNDLTSYRLTACTLAGNRTGEGGTGPGGNGNFGVGGGVSNGAATLENCLIALNTGFGTAPDVQVAGLTTVGDNLLGTAANQTVSGPLPTISAEPLLASLGDYGGPTQTMPPLPGSPAIDAAGGKGDIQQINIGSLPVSFTLSFNGFTTTSLNETSAAFEVAEALTALPTIGAGNVSVTRSVAPGNNNILFTVSFIGNLAVGNQNAITSTEVSVVTLQDGFFGSARTTDQRGFPIVGLPDLGAAEYQGNADLGRFWETDWDDDGNPFGLEFALGTNPSVSDLANPRNLTFTWDASGNPRMTFGRNSAANSSTIWRLTRSTTLQTGSFEVIFIYHGPTNSDVFVDASGSYDADSFEIFDMNPPPGQAFYRIEAVSP